MSPFRIAIVGFGLAVISLGVALATLIIVVVASNEPDEIAQQREACESAAPPGFVNATTRAGLASAAVEARECLYFSHEFGAFRTSIPPNEDELAIPEQMAMCERDVPAGFVNATTFAGLAAAPRETRQCVFYSDEYGAFRTSIPPSEYEFAIPERIEVCERALPFGFVNLTRSETLNELPALCVYHNDEIGVRTYRLFEPSVEGGRWQFHFTGMGHIQEREWDRELIEREANCGTDSDIVANLIRGNPLRGGLTPPESDAPYPYACYAEWVDEWEDYLREERSGSE